MVQNLVKALALAMLTQKKSWTWFEQIKWSWKK